MADDLAPERLRRFKAVLGHEREIQAVVTSAVLAYLVLAESLTIRGDDLPPDLSQISQANPDWEEQSRKIAAAAVALWLLRARNANASTPASAAEPFGVETHDRLQKIPDELYQRLSLALDGATRAGLSPREMNEVAAFFFDLDNWGNEIDRITRTVTVSAFNAGDNAGWLRLADERGATAFKRWLATPDLKTRHTHAEAGADPLNIWIPATQPFFVGGFYAQVPGDPSLPPQEAVNCRCTALYRLGSLVASAPGPGTQGVAMPNTNPAADLADITVTVQDGSTAVVEDEMALPDGWRGRIAALDAETGDERWLATPQTGVRTREYPLTLTFMHVGEDDIPIGNVERVWTEMHDGAAYLYGEGRFDLVNEEGRKYAGMLRDGIINTVSIHPDQVSAEARIVDPDGNLLPEDYDVESIVTCDPNGFCKLEDGYSQVTDFVDWRLAGLAMVSVPAYTEARIEAVFDYAPSDIGTDALVAVGGFTEHRYRAESFAVKASKPTPLQITEDGRIYGHLATWDACHMDFPGMCLSAPAAVDGFNRFHQHSARLEDGSLIAVGALTFGDGHSSAGSLYASRAQYSDVATIAAKVVASEDEWGVFIAGEMVPNFDMALADVVCYAPLSGHWEPDPDLDGALVLIAAHAVVTPGFNVRSLVAAFSPETDRHSLILTSRRAHTSTTAVDIDAIVAAVEARIDTRTARRAKLAELRTAMGLPEHAARRRAERVAELRTRIGA